MIVQMNTSNSSKRTPVKRVCKGASGYAEVLRSYFPKDEMNKREFFKVLTLDLDLNVTGCIHAGTGSIDCCPVLFREVARGIAENDARFIVLGHNHPSGRLFPSLIDVTLTEQMGKLARMLSVVVLDHIVLSSTGYYSFVEDQKMKV